MNKILGDDESVRIARARGQTSLTVAGDTITLDLSRGSNPFLSAEDEAILMGYREDNNPDLHTDKKMVRTDGLAYDAAGRPSSHTAGDYNRPSWSNRPWGSTGSGT